MGKKNRKSTIERLPKGERTHGINKIIVLSPSEPSSSSFPQRSAVPAQRSGVVMQPEPAKVKPTYIDDEALARVLVKAGPAAAVAALQVSRQWRLVAKRILSDFYRLDLGKFYRTENGRADPPTHRQVARMLSRFPNLSILSIHSWLYQDVMGDIVGYLATNYRSLQLREFEISGVSFSGSNLVHLLKRCPGIHTLRMAGHDCISDTMLSDLATYCRHTKRNVPGDRLRCINISRSRHVTGDGVVTLLSNRVADSIFTTKCPSVHRVVWTPSNEPPVDELSLTGCTNLVTFRVFQKEFVPAAAFDLMHLNLSQCSSLRKLEFLLADLHQTIGHKLRLRHLNLSGCNSLQYFRSDLFETPSMSFANLESLSLFGVRRLPGITFASTVNFGASQCALPKLRRLDLNGCSLEVLKLIGYEQLTSVDCSGCPELTALHIEGSWNLERVVVKGRRMPLHDVRLILPIQCLVEGQRKNWHWESQQSKQIISFP